MTCILQYVRSTAWLAWLMAIGAVTAVAIVRAEGAPQSQRSEAEFVDRLNIAALYIDGLDGPYNAELARLDGVCRAVFQDPQSCRERNLRATSVKAASVHSAPSADSPIIGDLYAVLSFHPQNQTGYRLEFRSRGSGARPAVWLESIGDWGYGIEIPGVRLKGQWMQLIDAALPATSWVDGSGLGALAGSIEGSLITLPSIRAVWANGAKKSIAPGSYLVQRIRGSEVTVRAEVETDFPCGEEVKAPAVMPASVRINARDLFTPGGTALFAETYGRGC